MRLYIKKNTNTLMIFGYIVMLLLTLEFRTQYSIRMFIWWGYAAFTGFIVLTNKKIRVAMFEDKTITGFFLLLLIQSLLNTLISFTSDSFSYTIEYLRMYLPYIFALWFASVYFAKKKCINAYIRCTHLCISLWLIVLFFRYFSMAQLISGLPDIFERYGRYRENYGYGSPDIPACMALCVIICSMLMWRVSGRLKRIWLQIVNTIMVLLILSTGTRSQIVALVLILGMILYFKIGHVYLSSERQTFLLKLIKLMLLILGFSFVVTQYMGTTNLEEMLTNSNRRGLLEINIPLLLHENKLLTGLVYASAGRFGEGIIGQYHVYYVDNYYVYILMSCGVIGLLMQMTAIYLVIRKVYRVVKKYDVRSTEVIIIMIIINLIMGLFSCAVIYPNYIHCTLFWALPIMYIISSKNKE